MTPRTGAERQDCTDAYFNQAAEVWRDIYAGEGLQGVVYRARMQVALSWIDALRLAPGAKVLDVGCGAGIATVQLARRGYAVHASDSSPEMVALASRAVADAGLGDVVDVSVADVHDLHHEDGTFALVVALGVLPWLHSPQRALGQVRRALAPDGHAILSADNRLRLNGLVEPAENPLIVPAKYVRRVAQTLRGSRPRTVCRLDSPGRVDRWLLTAGLKPERRTTVGFGPFTFCWHPILPERIGLRLHHGLDHLAEHRVPRLRRHGWHYLVLARRV